MNIEIPVKLRLLAVMFHMIAAIPAAAIALHLTLAVFTINSNLAGMLPSHFSSYINNSGSHIFQILIGVIFYSSIFNWFLWRATKNIHPFLDQSSRDAMNSTLNTLLVMGFCLLLSAFLFFMTGYQEIQEINTLELIAIITDGIAIAYFLNSIITGVFAWRGYRIYNLLIYPFIRSM